MEKEAQYLYDIISPIVSNQEELVIEQTVDELGILLTIKAAKEDIGGLIGKQGETARAFRKIVRIYGMVNDKRISIKIFEPEKDENLKL